jgi:hypothetical protein
MKIYHDDTSKKTSNIAMKLIEDEYVKKKRRRKKQQERKIDRDIFKSQRMLIMCQLL